MSIHKRNRGPFGVRGGKGSNPSRLCSSPVNAAIPRQVRKEDQDEANKDEQQLRQSVKHRVTPVPGSVGREHYATE